ncbi:MAG: hypothetical protein ACRDSS_05080, partial [Actinocrinis sp.]
MTDETRPTPQGGAAAGGQDPVDALASWFRATPKEDESAAGDGDSNGNDGADDGEHAEASSPSESSTAPSPITPGSTAGGHRPVDDDDEPRQARAPRTRPETTPPAAPVPTPPDDEADAESPAEPASTAPATSVPAKSAPADAAPAEAESPNATVGPARSGVWSAQPDSADGGDPPDADNVATPAPKDGEKSSDEPAPSADQTAVADLLASFNAGTPSSTAARESATDEATDEETPAVAEDNARTQLIPRTAAGPESPREAGDRTQLLPLVPPAPPAAPTEMLPRIEAATPGAAVRGLEPQTSKTYGGKVDDDAVEGDWNPEPDPEPYSPAEQTQHSYQQQFQQAYRAPSGPPRAPAQPLGSAALPAGMSVRGYDDYDDFDRYDDPSRGPERRPSRARRALFATTGVIVLVLVVGAGLVFSGKVSVLGLSAKAPVPTVGFSPSGADAGTDATQTGTAFLTAWENGGLKAASNITDDPATALDQLTQYKSALKVSGLTIQPGSATTAGWMTFNVSAQVGSPASAWNYSSGLATYSKQVNGYTRWFVKWQPNLMFTSLKAGQHLTLGTIPAVANKVVDRNGAEITSSNAPSLRGIVSALKKSAPPSDGTPGQEVQITDAKGAKVSKVAKISDPVSTGAVKTTIDLHAQAAAQT